MFDTRSQIFLPVWLIYLQCICFSILFAIWVLPETILIRHICLITGGLISLRVIYVERRIFVSKRAWPIWILIGLFFWVIFHLLFLGSNPALQWYELTTIWKRVFIGFIFALGFGLALTNSTLGSRTQQVLWWIIYLGFCMPTLIYLLKWVSMYLMNHFQLAVPEYLQLYGSSAKFYIHKSSYVFFCLPALAIAVGRLRNLFITKQSFSKEACIYIVTIVLVLFNFIMEKDRNGELYAFILLTFAYLSIYLVGFKTFSKKKISLIFGSLLIVGSSFFFLFSSNPQWQTFISDSEIALQVDKYDNWKFAQIVGQPLNAKGEPLVGSNYERISWLVVGSRLMMENPLGYGLVEQSFGHLGRQKWPDAILSQSHSGWIDWTLGMGFPGTFLILLASLLAWHQARQVDQPWGSIGRWGLFSILLLYCTTEVSQRVYIDAFIFCIAWVASMSLLPKQKLSQ
jgi:hypothetical protein